MGHLKSALLSLFLCVFSIVSGRASKPPENPNILSLDAKPLETESKTVLVEAEAFDDRGGWVVDQQFMDEMGSPYLLAHGLGRPVHDAKTRVNLPAVGQYHVYVRTLDWVARWGTKGSPGRFQLLVNGKALETTFGTGGTDWFWHKGGQVTVEETEVELTLRDLTGFEGRCDAIVFSPGRGSEPPNADPEMATFRRRLLGHGTSPSEAGPFDLVVVGGGIAGICASLSGARLGLTVALVQDRPVLGGNNSSEVRVWLNGSRNVEPYPRVGDVVWELEQARRAHYGATNTAELYEDDKKLALVTSERNLTLFLEHRANGVDMTGDRIRAVVAQHTTSGRRIRIAGRWFVDSTGDGCVGFLAGADHEMTTTGHMGRCNLWNVIDTGKPSPFPRCPWALDLGDKPFPGRARAVGGQPGDRRGLRALGAWYWESGFDRDPILEGEAIRDWNFRAMYGAWDALKNVDQAYPTYRLNWAAYISGKRESRRLLGDLVLTKKDVVEKTEYPDGCVPTGWPIDLHLPDPRYEAGYEGDAFISRALYTRYTPPYWIPYRCLYSRNVSNLFMAGRDVSVTHEALGTVRVMRTGGLMGEIVGMAASLCKKYDTDPRGVYPTHLGELKELMKKGAGKTLSLSKLKDVGENLARSAKVTTSGDRDPEASPASLVNDGKADLRQNQLRWLSHPEVPNWIEFQWSEARTIIASRIVSGYSQSGGVTDPIESFVFQYFDGEEWREIAETQTVGNRGVEWSRRFKPVTAARVRLLIRKTKIGISRIWEVELYEAAPNRRGEPR